MNTITTTAVTAGWWGRLCQVKPPWVSLSRTRFKSRERDSSVQVGPAARDDIYTQRRERERLDAHDLHILPIAYPTSVPALPYFFFFLSVPPSHAWLERRDCMTWFPLLVCFLFYFRCYFEEQPSPPPSSKENERKYKTTSKKKEIVGGLCCWFVVVDLFLCAFSFFSNRFGLDSTEPSPPAVQLVGVPVHSK